MTFRFDSLLLVLGLSAVASPALADDAPGAAGAAQPAAAPAAAAATGPGSVKPGAETKALQPLVGVFKTSGTVKANAHGPGSPELPSKGTHKCHWVLGDLWLQCEIEDTAGKGKEAMTWKGYVLTGWDFEAKAYRTVGVDNMGGSFVMQGAMDGKKLVLESKDATMMGKPIKMKLTFDLADPKAIKFTDERSMGDAPYALAEETVMKK
jgi:hypothetical protein